MSRLSRRSAAAAACAIGASVLWVSIETVGAALLERHHPVQVVWLRYASHLTILVPAAVLLRGRRAFATRRPVLQLLRGALMFAMPVTFVLAARSLGAEATWGIFWTMPLLVLLAAWPLLRERASRAHWLSIGAGAIAAMLVFRPHATNLPAVLLALACAGTFAGYLLVSRRLTAESLTASVFYTALGSVTLVTALALPRWTPVAASELAYIAAIGALSIVFLGLLDHALALAEATFVAGLLYAVIVWEMLLLMGLGLRAAGSAELIAMGLALAACATMIVAGGGTGERRRKTSEAAAVAAPGGVS